jgi:hypothetical protein
MYIVDFYSDMLPLRGIAKNNPEFCMLLFYNIISNKNLVATDSEIKNHRSKPKYDSYIRSKDCREINKFAHKIKGFRSKEQFEKFLIDKANYPNIKQELFENFTSRYPERNITMDNLFVEIAEIFDTLIADAADEYKKSSRNNPRKTSNERDDVPIIETTSVDNAEDKRKQAALPEDVAYDGKTVSTSTTNDNHTEDNSVNITNTNTIHRNENKISYTINVNLSSKNENELEKLKALIKELYACFLELDHKGGAYNIGLEMLSQDERKETKQEFEKLRNDFINKNNELRYYYLSFSELEAIFENMIHISRTMKYGVYIIRTETNKVMSVLDPEIDEYKECINTVWQALLK